MSRYAYPNPGEAEAKLKQALALLDLFQGIPDPAAEIARLRQASGIYDAVSKALDCASLTNTILEAELTKLRTVYAAAVEECKQLRLMFGSGGNTARIQRAIVAHDAARAEAGMENL